MTAIRRERLIPMERTASQTLLGIRFWDRLLGAPVAQGLLVSGQRLSADRSSRLGRAIQGRATPSGVVAFFGLAPEERTDPDPTQHVWETRPADRLIAVDARDPLGRYLPLSFVARLPQRGAFRGRGDWLSTPLLRPEPAEGQETGVHLWPTPERGVPNGYAVICAQLVVGDSDDPPPAAYALVEVRQDTDFRYFGLADERGILTLPLPYPPVSDPANGSYPSLDNLTFALTLTVRYTPVRQMLPGSTVPNLETLLLQPRARIGTNWRIEPRRLRLRLALNIDLHYGRPLILRTAIGRLGSEETESVLRVQPI